MQTPHPIHGALRAALGVLPLLCVFTGLGSIARAQSQPGAQPAEPSAPYTVLKLSVQPLPAGIAGHRYSQTFPIQGGQSPYSFSLTGDLPPGLHLDKLWNTVHIDGTPRTIGQYPITLTVSDAFGQKQQAAYTLNIKPTPDTETAVMVSVNENTTGVDIVTSGESLTLALAEHVMGIDSASVALALQLGVPESITAHDATTIDLGFLVIPYTIPPGTALTPYSSITFSGTGGSGETYVLHATGNLPSGMSFGPGGTSTITLSGTPTVSGSFPFAISAVLSGRSDPLVQNYTLVIAKAAQTITSGPVPSPTYGDPPFNLTATASSGLPVTITPVSSLIAGSGPFTSTGAGQAGFVATQPGDATYAAAPPIPINVRIAPANLTVTAANVRRACGQNNPNPLPYLFTGFVNNDTSAVVTGTPVLTTTATQNSTVIGSPYPITITQGTLAAANYGFTFVNGDLTVTRGDQYITFYQPPPLSHRAYAGYLYLTATASSGLPVTFTASGNNNSAISATGSILFITGPGLITVTASVASSDCYNDAPPVIRTFTAP